MWIKHCDKVLQKQIVNEYNSSNLNNLLEELKNVRNKKFSETDLINLFNKYGIYLSIEDALVGTKVRGCMMIKGSNPVIYMTKYLDINYIFLEIQNQLKNYFSNNEESLNHPYIRIIFSIGICSNINNLRKYICYII